jgi:hypothetical protein
MTEEKANLRFVWLSNKGERVNGDAKSQQRRQMLHSHFFEKTDGGVVPLLRASLVRCAYEYKDLWRRLLL